MPVKLARTTLKSFLDEKVERYNVPDFIQEDPVLFPHRFTRLQDQEIIGFLMATIAWGNRKSILKSGERLLELFGNAPYEYVMTASLYEQKELLKFTHRTFQGVDLQYFVQAFRRLYTQEESLQVYFLPQAKEQDLFPAIERFRSSFLLIDPKVRTAKHLSSPQKKSACKRIHLFLRWMIRQDGLVDLGGWQQISPSLLSCPLDVHSARVARVLGLLTRKSNDRKAVEELNENLRKLDPQDPAKYDFALFGLGVYEDF